VITRRPNPSPAEIDQITEITRRDIIDAISVGKCSWSGRFDEVEFLSRLFDLKKLPSKDYRYETASEDIWKHRTVNSDWSDDWVFYDDRLDIFRGPDERFLRFLCEMVHPAVRPNVEEAGRLVQLFNDHLSKDGWEIVETTRISEKPVYAARPLIASPRISVAAAKEVAFNLDAAYVSQQITRMESAINSDPELAIGTAKEFLETVCKTVLADRRVQYEKDEDLPKLVKLTVNELKLVPDELSNVEEASESIRVLLKNLAAVGHHLAELRNPFGTGHGKEAKHVGLEPKHARLAVGAASSLGVFLFECYLDNK
jgi:hypothetical protein